MEYYNNILCVSGSDLVLSEINPNGIMPLNTLKSLKNRGDVKALNRSCRNTPVLFVYDSLPQRYRQMYELRNGDPRKEANENSAVKRLKYDNNAFVWYSNYLLSNGDNLPLDIQKRYANEASLLQSIKMITDVSRARHKVSGGMFKMSWDKICEAINSKEVQKLYPHKLPQNVTSLRRKYNKFLADGYSALVHASYCNDNSRRVSLMTEKLLMSIYSLTNKPFGATVHNIYTMFIDGKYDMYDKSTGELYDPAMFRDKENKPLYLSESTVWRYLNNALNRAIVDYKRNDSLYFSNVHRPHHHRHYDCFALSKVSMDDRDLPRKMHDGNRVKAYYSYDAASGAVVGWSYSRKKDDALFLECLRSMFQIVKKNSLPMPAEVEVEHHIVNHFTEELDLMFPLVRWCRAGNSQEKYAEHKNRSKKYEVEHKNHNDIGRWWSKHEAYKTKSKREGADYAVKTFDYDRLVADDIADIMEYNNAAHPNKKRYAGMTRWQVLLECANYDAAQPNDAIIYRCIGELTKTTICNNQYVKVQHAKYQLPSPEIVSRLKPNDYNVRAYWLKNNDGEIADVWLYQGDKFLCKCAKIDPYNTARIEWTDSDKYSFAAQSSYVAQFDKIVREGTQSLAKIGFNESEMVAEAINMAEQQKPQPPSQPKKGKYQVDKLLASYDRANTINRANNNI